MTTYSIPLSVIIMYVLLIPCAAFFIYVKHRAEERPTVAATILKGVSTWIIICAALIGTLDTFGQPSVFSVLIIAGLAMGLSGDVAISLSKQDKLGLKAGMFFFGLGHLCYIAALIIVSRLVLANALIFVALYAVVFIVLLRNRANLKELFVPVLVYSAAITYMLSISVTMPFSVFPGGSILLVAGILFVISDTLLAKNNFPVSGTFVPSPATGRREVVLLICYFLAQSLFALSVYYFA